MAWRQGEVSRLRGRAMRPAIDPLWLDLKVAEGESLTEEEFLAWRRWRVSRLRPTLESLRHLVESEPVIVNDREAIWSDGRIIATTPAEIIDDDDDDDEGREPAKV
jgi:hypothetical protein